MPAEDDILLLQLIKQDDEKAFKHLFDTYFVSLCRFMSLYLRDKQEIEELALSIFMNLWEGRADLTLKISFKAYLFQSARNRCLNALRDEKDTVPIEGGEEYGYALAADTSVEMEELNRLIEEAVCSLPDKCGQVYRKSREEGKTNQEIAGEMGISVKTVEAQITKALKYNPQIQISAESETKRSIFRKRDKTKRSKKESAQHSKSRNKSFVMTSVSAL